MTTVGILIPGKLNIMQIKKTPPSRFENLPGYNFKANYIEVEEGLEMHYVDEGEGEVVLLLHGEPSWSYLYRKMIPVLVDNGYRAIAPDLIGFGKSDKPTAQLDYTYEKHVEWLFNFISKLGLNNSNLFCQDWGGLLGLRLAGEHPDLFSRIIAANTFLPLGNSTAPKAFKQWREFSQKSPDFQAGLVLQMGTTTDLSEEIINAYNAPFPDEDFKAGSRVFPLLVPFGDDDPHNAIPTCEAAWRVLSNWQKPFLTLFSDSDPIMNGLEKVFQSRVPGCEGMPHKIIKTAGHFLQEDKGEEIAQLVADFIKN